MSKHARCAGLQDLDVLIINSYAGSLTVGAKAVGLPIRGSYEDTGFGLVVQRANFPDLDYRETTDKWPAKQDLSSTVVLAHPPCSAFSSQTPAAHKGVETDAFACTKRVFRYGMKNGAAVIAVESVPRALEGAAAVHERYASRYGYHLYRVLQNAVSFGVPQWRPRFWAVFIRQDLVPSGNTFWKIPEPLHYATVGDVLDDAEPGPVLPAVRRHYERQVAALVSRLGWSVARVARVLERGTGRLHSVLSAELGEPADKCRDAYCTPRGHDSWVLRMLDADGFAPTLLLDSHWTYNGRPVSIAEYNVLMGFPRDYVFPERSLTHQRKYLSKGVCPPVAEWVLRQVVDNLRGTHTRGGVIAEPGAVINFNLKKADCLDKEAA